jgi:transcriptional regulator EpsA
MAEIDVKNNWQGAPIAGRRINEGHASILISRNSGNSLRLAAIDRKAPESMRDTSVLTAKERESFLHIVEATAKITRHYELFLLLQNEVQYFIPHQILISAWGDFLGLKPTLDVISAIQGVRTRQINGCGIEHALKNLYMRWIAGGRRPMLLDNTNIEGITDTSGNPCICTCSSRDCALNAALRLMRSVLVHGVRNERDDLDSLYVALNPVSVKNGQSVERFFSLVDPVVAQIDVAFRKVAALKSVAMTGGENAQRRSDNLSAREQEIVRWIAEGKTNTEIAAILGISSFTVKNHAQRIFRKLDATNRTEAVAKYRRENSATP